MQIQARAERAWIRNHPDENRYWAPDVVLQVMSEYTEQG